ncbi:MAG: hypothetical protein M3R72_02415 [Bacteroidota bacterium]|nr:hypothetical protein [Bacteroidota bacterium]
MTRQAIIEKTTKAINQLPEDKAEEISHFADFINQRYEEDLITENIQTVVSESNAFCFLKTEEDLYTLADAKEIYNG